MKVRNLLLNAFAFLFICGWFDVQPTLFLVSAWITATIIVRQLFRPPSMKRTYTIQIAGMIFVLCILPWEGLSEDMAARIMLLGAVFIGMRSLTWWGEFCQQKAVEREELAYIAEARKGYPVHDFEPHWRDTPTFLRQESWILEALVKPRTLEIPTFLRKRGEKRSKRSHG